MREAEIHDRIGRLASRRRTAAGLELGIGDDAAVLAGAPGRYWVVSTDNFNESAHFLSHIHSPEVVGYKSLARGLSDLAAMGARPRFFLLALTLPRSRTGAWLDGFLRGLLRAARRFRVVLAGGDTSRSNPRAGISINVTVVGDILPGRAVRRSGARPGDALFVSGTLGAAQLGLGLALAGRHRAKKWPGLLRRHLHPEPRIALGEWLAKNRLASAMMDTSDGLSADLARMCAASRVRACLDVTSRSWPGVRVPPPLAARFAKLRDARRLALHGGEDYELLFAVPRRLVHRIPRRFRGVRLTRIGEMLAGSGVVTRDAADRMRPLPNRGWDPFA